MLYPVSPSARDRFVVEHRGTRPVHDPWVSHGVLVEDECDQDGRIARVATVFLTGRECPWRCVMCDLWQHTIEADTPAGAIPAQLRAARASLTSETVTQIKLYNAGSFFDPRAVPVGDYEAVAAQLSGMARIVVESHPALIGARLDTFLAALRRHGAAQERVPALEVAMGLETAHPEALERMNKRMTVAMFADAAASLASRGVALRVFLLIAPPFVPPAEQDEWLQRSVDCAIECGATAISLIPTRPGNGAIDALAAAGAFRPPQLEDVERSAELALASSGRRARVFVDLWDIQRFAGCPRCYAARRARLHATNLEQRLMPRVACDAGCTTSTH